MNNVFSIQLPNGSLDLYKQDISWEWKNIRFSDGLRDQYSTDIEIPKTNNNMNLLFISGLLDSSSQLFGEQISPCVLTINGIMMDIYLQVVSINEDNITICLYERTLPTKVREKNIARIKRDDHTSIIAWNVNSTNAYPNWFWKYNYGMTYDHNYAQYHPVLKANTIIDNIKNECNVDIPYVSDDWYVMATRKKVCPENDKQTVEGVYSDGKFHIMGGQHITNDLSFSYSLTDINRITFNRACMLQMDIFVSWKAKNNGYNSSFTITHHRAETNTNNVCQIQLRGDLYTNKVERTLFTFLSIKQDDWIEFNMIDGNVFDMVRCVADMRITGYQITDDDYEQDLDYVARLPRLIVYNYAANQYNTWYFDASQYTLAYKQRNVSGTKHQVFTTPWTSFAWFGYYANLEDMTVSTFLWGICWLLGKKMRIANGELEFIEPNENIVLKDAVITEIQPYSDNFGMNNYIRFDNQENPDAVSTIDNSWLETNKDLHKSPFGYIQNLSNFVGKINQYENPKYDDGAYSCDYNETGFLVWWHVTQWNNMHIESEWIRDVPLQNFGLDKITQTMTVTIETTDTDVKDLDYVYLDGRKFMVVEGNTDMNTNQSTLTTVLVPTT